MPSCKGPTRITEFNLCLKGTKVLAHKSQAGPSSLGMGTGTVLTALASAWGGNKHLIAQAKQTEEINKDSQVGELCLGEDNWQFSETPFF